LFLIVIDLLANSLINLVNGNAIIIIGSVILRAISLLILFPFISFVVLLFTKRINVILITTSISICLIIPLVVFFLKSNRQSLMEVYWDLFTQEYLFEAILQPYIIASLICFYLYNRKFLKF